MTTQTHRKTAVPSRSRSIRTAVAFAASIALGATAPSALATPVVDQWITQEGVISNIGSVTNVFLPNTATNRHIIQWLSMNIGSGETMNFQGLSGYAVLNQVKTGMGRTEILGTLNALQGNVFIVNQAGVTFGAGSVVNARGITAAASSFAEAGGLDTPMRQAFMNNQAIVFNLVDTVTVEGAVDGGAAAAMLSATEGLSLLGTRVSNGGQLSGRTIVIAIGDQVIINDLDNPLSVVIDGKTLEQLASTPTHSDISGTAGDAGIHNTGTINATEGGSVSLAASDLVGLALAIHHEGEIVVAGGTADLLAGAGAVWTAGNDQGTGNLTEGLIDVSHIDGAGAIRMVASAILHEGTARATGPGGAITLHAADNVVMLGSGALAADGGLGSGHGGTINVIADAGTVWGEQGTAISTKGGLFGGDAGTITVSGDSLNILSATKINSNAGNNGSLSLSSAKDVTIDGTGAALEDLDTSDLSSSLLGEGEAGRIGAAADETLWYVDGDLAVSSDQTLRVEQSLINITSADRNWGFLGGDATFSGVDIRLKLGEVDGEFGTLKADNLTLNGHISLENHASLAADDTLRLIGGNIRGQSGVQHDLIASAGQELYINGDIGQAGLELGNTSLTAGSSMHMLGATESSEVPGQFVHIDGDLIIGGLEQGPGGSVSLSAIENVQGEVTGGVYVGSSVGTFDASFAGGLHVNAGGEFENYANITTDGDLYLSGASMTNVADLTSTNGAIELRANGTDPGQGVLSTDGMLSAATDLTLRSEATLTNSQSLTANGTISLASFEHDVINNASLTGGTGVVIAASQGSVQVNGDVHAGQTGLSSTADVVITSGGNVDLASTLTATGAASVTGDSITTSGTVHAQGDVTMDATTTHLVTATGAVTGDTVTISNGDITVSGTVDGVTSVSMSTDGDATILGDVQGEAVTVDASSIAVGQGGSIQGDAAVMLTANAGGTQQIDGDVTGDTVSMTNGTINVTGTVDGVTSVSLQTTDGDIVMDGSIDSTGDVTVKADNDSIDSSGSITGGTIKMTAGGDLAASGPLTAATSASMTGENVSLGVVTVDGAPQQTTGISVTANGGDINAEGNLTTTGVVEFTAMDGSVLVGGTANAHGLVASGRTITNTGEVHTGIGGTAMVGSERINIQNTLQSAGTISLEQSQGSIESMVIAADITGGAIGLVSGDLLLEAATVKSTSGDIGVNASMITLDTQASIDSAGDLRIGRGNQGQTEGFLQESDIQLAGNNLDLSAGGDINLLSRVNATNGVLTASADGRLFVGGNLGSDDALASISLTASEVVLGGELNGRSWIVDQIRADGDISLNGDDLSTLSSLPTVYGFGDTLTIASNGGDITVGNHQGFAYLGDLTLDAGRELTVGDMTTLGDLTLRGATILVHRRAPGSLTDHTGGSVWSEQTSIVSDGDLLVSGQLQYGGEGLDPRFAGVQGIQGVPNRDRATTNVFQAVDMEITTGGRRRLTLRSLEAFSPIIPGVSELLAAESHPGEETVRLKGGVPDLETQESLAALGIELVESLPTPTPENAIGRGGKVANDLPTRVARSGRIMVTRHRVNASLISRALAEYHVMQNESPVKGDFNSIGPLHHTAMTEYRAAEGANAPSAGLVAFLQEHPSDTNDRVLRFETQLDDLYLTLSKAGLSSGEVAGSRQFVMQRLESAVPVTGVAHHGSSPKGL